MRLAFRPLLLSLSIGCATVATPVIETGPLEGDAAPWTSLSPLDGDDEFHFAIVTDRTGGHRPGVFENAMGKVNLLQPAFVLSVGDLIEGYTEDPAVLDAEWDEFEGFIAKLEMPFFYAVGNHDMNNEVMANEWRDRFGPTFYSFRYKGVLFLVLNSELFTMATSPGVPVPGPETHAEQMAFVERALSGGADARHTIVVVHQPFWDAPRIHPDWLRVEELLGDRPYTVFAGHYHQYTKHVRHDRRFITLATTGGGSGLKGIPHGEFDHVALVTMRASGPVLANLMLDGIQDEDVRTESVRGLVRALGRAVRVVSAPSEELRFRSGTVRFEIANPGTRPLTVRGRFGSSRDLEPGKAEVVRTLPAGGSDSVELPVVAPRAVPFETLAGAVADWTLETETEDGRPVEVAARTPILPERTFRCGRGGPVTVDGKLDEWGTLPFVVDAPVQVDGEGHQGPEDSSFRFGVRDGGDRLFVAVEVTDDSLVASEEESALRQDGVTLIVDARPRAEREANSGFFAAAGDGSLQKMNVALVGAVPPRPDPIIGRFLAPLPEGAESAGDTTRGGYAVELALPSAALDAAQRTPWTGFRLDVSVRDFDEGGHEGTTLHWRANRFGEMAVEGSGSFVCR